MQHGKLPHFSRTNRLSIAAGCPASSLKKCKTEARAHHPANRQSAQCSHVKQGPLPANASTYEASHLESRIGSKRRCSEGHSVVQNPETPKANNEPKLWLRCILAIVSQSFHAKGQISRPNCCVHHNLHMHDVTKFMSGQCFKPSIVKPKTTPAPVGAVGRTSRPCKRCCPSFNTYQISSVLVKIHPLIMVPLLITLVSSSLYTKGSTTKGPAPYSVPKQTHSGLPELDIFCWSKSK